MHPYTVELLTSAPKLKPDVQIREIVKGDVPSPIDIPPGCPFHPRCPKRVDSCDKLIPELREMNGRFISCHLFS